MDSLNSAISEGQIYFKQTASCKAVLTDGSGQTSHSEQTVAAQLYLNSVDPKFNFL